MAITKLLRIKESKSGAKASGLLRCLNYICNDEKTESGKYISGNCGSNPQLIYDEMLFNKKNCQNESGTQGFHYVISFSPNETVSPEMALTIAKDFIHELLDDKFLYVAAAHTDTSHMHVHICFDSVNIQTGTKFHSGKYDWVARIQPITDHICSKYGLSTLSFDPTRERVGMFHKEWEEAGTNAGSWNDIIRDDIDDALMRSTSWNDFIQNLRNMHYEVKDGKYLSLRPHGKEKAIRSARLGAEYLKERLQERLGNSITLTIPEGKNYKTYSNPIPILRIIRLNQYFFNPLQRLFYFRWQKLSHIRKPGFTSNWRYKSDVTNLSRTSEQLIYLFEANISSIDDITKRLNELTKSRGSDASKERKLCKGILETYSKINNISDIVRDKEAYIVPLLTSEKVYQIHINQVLFAENTNLENETFTVRIPKSTEYVSLFSDDSRNYGNGMISSYIYADADYQILNVEGTPIYKISGTNLKDKFKNKEIERTERYGKTIV